MTVLLKREVQVASHVSLKTEKSSDIEMLFLILYFLYSFFYIVTNFPAWSLYR